MNKKSKKSVSRLNKESEQQGGIDMSLYYQPKPKQAQAHKNRSKYLLYGGSMGSGKSYFLCAEAIKKAMQYNGGRLVIVRKELSVLRRTTLITFRSICPPEIIKKFNESRLEIEFINGSSLLFLDADIAKDPLLNKIKGLEISWFGCDEANEISKSVYDLLKTRLRWVLPDGTIPPYEGRLVSNPEAGWLIPTFIQSNNPNEVYIEALTTDNYDENSDYVRNLKDAFKDNPSLLRKYLFADWSLTESINQLIPSDAIANAAEWLNGHGTALGVDVARFGNDNTVFVLIEDGNVELVESYPQTSTTEVATRAIQLITDYQISPECVGIDAVGVGAGVVDNLKQQGYEVVELQGGARPEETDSAETFKPFNLRSQMYWELRKSLIAGEIGSITDEALKTELQSIKYEICNDRTVKVVGKEIIKKTLGKSPDRADALAYANFVSKMRAKYKTKINLYFPNPIPRKLKHYKEKKCYQPWQQMQTSPEGDLRICCGGIQAGNIFDMDATKSYNSPLCLDVRKKLLEKNTSVHAQCQYCPYQVYRR